MTMINTNERSINIFSLLHCLFFYEKLETFLNNSNHKWGENTNLDKKQFTWVKTSFQIYHSRLIYHLKLVASI